jgi:RimJ/RimL family protein N-acetyltransferase
MVNRPPERIEEPPVFLRRYVGSDLEALLEAVSTSSDHLRPWLAWASVEPLEAGLRNFISGSVEGFERGENFDYGIWSMAQSTLIGGAGLHPRLGPGQIEIGYWVRDGWQRRGVASATARVLTTAAFQLPGIEEVRIHCDEANVTSAGIPRRLGFRLLRIVEDEADAPAEIGRRMEWAITAEEWQPL